MINAIVMMNQECDIIFINFSQSWGRTPKKMSQIDNNRAADITVEGIANADYSTEQKAIEILSEIATENPETVIEKIGRVILDDKRGLKFYYGNYKDLVNAIPYQNVIHWIQNSGIEGARRLARHLPLPFLGHENKPTVPPLTEYVLKKYGDDERVFKEFIVGGHIFQMYSVNIAEEHRKEAEVARKFLDHSVKKIREWA
jgi:hypothetical protein